MTAAAEQIMTALRPFATATVASYKNDFSVHDYRMLRHAAVGTRFIWSCRVTGTHLFAFDGPGWIDRERRDAADLILYAIKLRDGSRDWHELRIYSPDEATVSAMSEKQVVDLMTAIRSDGRDPRFGIRQGDRVSVRTTNGGLAVYRIPNRWSPDASVVQFLDERNNLIGIEHERIAAINLA